MMISTKPQKKSFTKITEVKKASDKMVDDVDMMTEAEKEAASL